MRSNINISLLVCHKTYNPLYMYYWLKRSCFNLYLKGGEENLTISTGSIHAHPKASRFLGLWLIRSLINIFLWLVMSLGSKVDHWTQQEIWSISLNFQKCHCATAMSTAENARTTSEVEDNAVQMAWRLQEVPPTHWTTQSKWKVFDRSMVGGWSPAYVLQLPPQSKWLVKWIFLQTTKGGAISRQELGYLFQVFDRSKQCHVSD